MSMHDPVRMESARAHDLVDVLFTVFMSYNHLTFVLLQSGRVVQVPLEELLDDLEGLNIGSEDPHAHAQHSASDVEMMTE
jgi:hypothetical protein